MSVQAGMWNFDGRPLDLEFLSAMCSTLKEYGPDGQETHVCGCVGMLYRPFHTTADSLCETQPHTSKMGKVVTWDGRLDNRDELLALLDTELGPDQSDVAIAAAGLDRWGTGLFSKIVGDWALSSWDPGQHELILARDYIGIRSLFYSLGPKRIVWCNHLSALALCGELFSLSDEYCRGYLTTYPDTHLTPYREILSVPPGSFIRCRKEQPTRHAYWSFNPKHEIRYSKDVEYEEHFRALFRQSVHRRLRTDSPILVGLSGGLDSSSIVCMADDILRTEGTQVSSLDTFSFCDRDEPEDDDLFYFTKVEKRRGCSGHHAELRATGDSFFVDVQFAAVPGFGERGELKVARSEVLARGHYRVLLSGIGGDEFSGQALDFRVQLADLLVCCRLGELGQQLTAWGLITRRPWIQLLLETVSLLLTGSSRLRTNRSAAERPWINQQMYRRTEKSALAEEAEKAGLWKPGPRDAWLTYASMARQVSYNPVSIPETRYPFLDQTLTEFLTAIPLDQLLRPGQRRSLMRRALRDLLPAEIVSRHTKAGAARCVTLAVSKHWRVLQNVLDAPLTSTLGYVNPTGLREALIAVKNGQITLQIIQLLRTLGLEFWLREAVARRVISLPYSPQGVSAYGPQKEQAVLNGNGTAQLS